MICTNKSDLRIDGLRRLTDLRIDGLRRLTKVPNIFLYRVLSVRIKPIYISGQAHLHIGPRPSTYWAKIIYILGQNHLHIGPSPLKAHKAHLVARMNPERTLVDHPSKHFNFILL